MAGLKLHKDYFSLLCGVWVGTAGTGVACQASLPICSLFVWLTWASSQHGDLKAVVEEAKPHSSGQVNTESQLLSCLLMSHWPKQITWPSPESMWEGTAQSRNIQREDLLGAICTSYFNSVTKTIST